MAATSVGGGGRGTRRGRPREPAGRSKGGPTWQAAIGQPRSGSTPSQWPSPRNEPGMGAGNPGTFPERAVGVRGWLHYEGLRSSRGAVLGEGMTSGVLQKGSPRGGRREAAAASSFPVASGLQEGDLCWLPGLGRKAGGGRPAGKQRAGPRAPWPPGEESGKVLLSLMPRALTTRTTASPHGTAGRSHADSGNKNWLFRDF